MSGIDLVYKVGPQVNSDGAPVMGRADKEGAIVTNPSHGEYFLLLDGGGYSMQRTLPHRLFLLPLQRPIRGWFYRTRRVRELIFPFCMWGWV